MLNSTVNLNTVPNCPKSLYVCAHMLRTLKTYFLFSFCLLVLLFIKPGCANIVPPEGGPRDSLPPVLIKALPADSMVKFTGQKIILSFNEYIQLDAAKLSNIIVSPLPEKQPLITGKLENITVKLRDSLQPNTTYSINFGDAIKDVNEGNPYRNYTYVFSTGDSLSIGTITGRVQLAETGAIDSTLIATLYTNTADSAVKKLKPLYYTRLNGKGNFEFHFLPDGVYNLFILPNDFTRKYDDSTKMFAFTDSVVVVSNGSTAPLTLYAFEAVKREEPSRPATTISDNKKPAKDTVKKITYTTSLKQNEQSLLEPLRFTFDKKVTVWDSAKISLCDTNYNKLIGYSIEPDSSGKIFSLKRIWKQEEYYTLLLDRYAFADSNGTPLRKTDTLHFNTKSERDYGSIRLRFKNIDTTRHPVLQLYSGLEMVEAAPLTSYEFFRVLFEPGDYELRILYDTNQNGKWDSGNYLTKQQPEIVEKINQQINIKTNWENEVNINL